MLSRTRDPEGNEVKNLILACELAGKKILEIGCGDGWLSWQYVVSARKVIGIDPSFADLKEARNSLPSEVVNFWLAQSMGEGLPFPSGVFDIVFYSNTL